MPRPPPLLVLPLPVPPPLPMSVVMLLSKVVSKVLRGIQRKVIEGKRNRQAERARIISVC